MALPEQILIGTSFYQKTLHGLPGAACQARFLKGRVVSANREIKISSWNLSIPPNRISRSHLGNEMTSNVKLLSKPINFAVVQLPERQYPGVVI